jgi:hypothetical protein
MKTFVVCALVLTFGCKKSVSVADESYFGKAVAAPRGLANVRLDMTEQEALAAGVRVLENGVHGVPSGVRDVKLLVGFDERPTPRVKSIFAWVSEPAATHLRGWLRHAWGAPVAESEREQIWQGDAWRVAVTDAPENEYAMQFWPAVTPAFWGRTPGALPAPLAKLRRGMKKPEIDALVPPSQLLDDGITFGCGGELQPQGMSSVTLFMNADHAEPMLLAAWGPGKVVAGDHIYEDPASGWRATLHRDQAGNVSLDYEPL